MNSYYSIYININGRSLLSRLYGDRIECPEEGICIYRKEIKSYRFIFFRKKIKLETETGTVISDYHKYLLSWFDPFFYIRWFSLILFTMAPLVMGIFFIRSPLALVFLIISLMMGVLGYFFFKFSNPDCENGTLKIFILLTIVCLPVIYWYPVSGFVFASAAGVLVLFYLIFLVYSNALNIKKYYFSISWVILILFFYFWIIAGLQAALVFKNFQGSRKSLSLNEREGTLTVGKTVWKKPLDWKLEDKLFFLTVLKRQSLLWTFAPFAPQVNLSSETYPELGWVSCVPSPPETTLEQINKHLYFQINILLSKLVSVEKNNPYLIFNQGGIYEQIQYYDMQKQKNYKLIVVIVPQMIRKKPGSIVFALKIPKSASTYYYLDLLKEGFKIKG